LVSLFCETKTRNMSSFLGGILQILLGVCAIAGIYWFAKAFESPDFEYDDETKSAFSELNKEERTYMKKGV